MRRAITAVGLAVCVLGCSSTSGPPGEPSTPSGEPSGARGGERSPTPSSVPAPVPADGPFELAYGDGPADGRDGACSLGWWTGGELVVDPRGGTGVIVEGGDFASVGDTMQVLWWPKFTGRRVGTEVEVRDPDGHVVATTGQRYRIEAAYPFDAGFVVCGGELTPLPPVANVLADAAAAYLAADRKFKQANERAFAAYNQTSTNFESGTDLHRALAENDVAFTEDVARITMPNDSAPVARRLFECHTMLYHREKAAQFAKSVVEYNTYRAQTEDKRRACSAIGNELRITLGLPEVPVDGVPDSP
jgi:hypothetical protein